MSAAGFAAVIFAALLTENVVFVQLLGLSPILKGIRTNRDILSALATGGVS